MISRSPSGHRQGQSHQRAKLLDLEVVAMRAMYKPYVCGYGEVARAFNCGVSTARDICTYRTRINV